MCNKSSHQIPNYNFLNIDIFSTHRRFKRIALKKSNVGNKQIWFQIFFTILKNQKYFQKCKKTFLTDRNILCLILSSLDPT